MAQKAKRRIDLFIKELMAVNSGIILNFQLSLRLPEAINNVKIPPSTYWGIIVTRPKTANDLFADQEAFLVLIERAAGQAAEKAVAENDSLGLPTPVRGDDNKVAFRLRGQRITNTK